MGSEFGYFLDIIPPEMYSRTKATICRYIAIFEPVEFFVGNEFCVDDYHFLLFFGNAPGMKINDVEYRAKKGDVVVIRPWDKIYGIPGESEEYGKFLHIAVKKELFQKIADEIAGGKTFEFRKIHGRCSNQLLYLIGCYQQEMMNYGEAFPQMILSLSTQIVFQLIRDLNADHKKAKDRTVEDSPYIRKAINLMQQYYATNISIKDISDLIYLSPYHFKRIFKEYTGQTPHSYLTNIRLEKAKGLLEKNEHSIEETARLCGFVNSSHFAVVFKRYTKMSPTEYRKIYARG